MIYEAPCQLRQGASSLGEKTVLRRIGGYGDHHGALPTAMARTYAQWRLVQKQTTTNLRITEFSTLYAIKDKRSRVNFNHNQYGCFVNFF